MSILSRTAPDNSPTALASELADAREAYDATRSDVYARATARVHALENIIDEADQERQAVLAIAGQTQLSS